MMDFGLVGTKTTPKAYGCVFCVTGRETAVARSIENDFQGVRATAVLQVKRRSVNGVTSLMTQVVFPGYVFLEAEPDDESVPRIRREGMFRLLTTSERTWQLYGNDRRFAEWIFSQNGLIELSKAYREGDRIRIVSGPLKDLEGHILRVDRRNRSGQIALTLQNRLVKAWLGFEYVDRIDGTLPA